MSETFRQIVHLLMGVIGAAVILSLDDRGAFIFVSAALVAQFLVCDAITRGYDIPVLSRVMDESERNEKVPLKGGIAYAAGALFCLAVFSREYTAVGLVTVGVLDSVSTLVGLRFGRHVVRGKKSLEGTVAGIIAAALALSLLIPWWAAAVVAAVGGIIEAYFPLDDNVAVQVGACVTLAAVGVGVGFV
ncbi:MULTISPECIES: phosphatidate cytidylyltransferase [unclassified Methanoculleus]|uniref:diacylglycerol/polyprenol kinase family protein n=1 Tax=unclassified Methanoculleus TaxID=2619537 RepID=UPI0025F79EB5|nr:MULTISPECIES: phosphatidate cytidylyltransferase [unclassified Methanoculleus]MCK9317784.1 phosphatidate cytidylyltransferase [Methanoculleus sp.]MDD2255057.1 phosphatidate cytidylyltransferase [Methanoculleus sp.]MDD2788067.1 phosphatidate cytidylyltransferase [Methanoculleus sp.]MDD3216661.1 phosphatidate cytidylyltransferase [Methanoculleus sp.]MDD4315001.1 phosphatidate cytidylyltransferase [Methanoculleus sp.]